MASIAETATKLWYLSKIEILFDLTPSEIQEIERLTRMIVIPKYQTIYLPGDPSDTIYFLKQGWVRISGSSPNGKQITLAILKQGDIFGETDSAGCPRDTIAEAMEDTLLCLISKTVFEAVLKQYPPMHLRVTKLIGRRLQSVESQIKNLVFHSAPARLARLLLKLVNDYGEPMPEGTSIGIKLTHQDIAELISVSRPTVTELLNQFAREQLITTVKRRLILLDRKRLAQLAEQ